MLELDRLYDRLSRTSVRPWLETLPTQLQTAPKKHGHMEQWQQAVASLPDALPSEVDLVNGVRIGRSKDIDGELQEQLVTALKQLKPWRKGPFELFGLHLDTEWRSDWKWERIKDQIQPLEGRVILDVGCGNGYYAWRMAGAGAALVIGLDPSRLFEMQYAAMRRYLPQPEVYVLPLGIEHLPGCLCAFDTVFSMGVLYHRREPLEHLAVLGDALRPGGELVLETLVLAGEQEQVLVPEDRYAQMRNVWAIPSCGTLRLWLAQCGFQDVRIVDVTPTTVQEQRATDWMMKQSLADFLDPNDVTKTIEGYPGPVRGVAIATKPE
ncbi:tRNA U34 carboxymethyltransferase [Acaryochloris thomasi RCC1774]|uniref:tRNA U34 carboxymethyltransferase n=1 Tax=Acaryochloris thomasi RCC1774 TaxID=1764569 RepID=A0A2W1JPA8_9CYAN|nr:tRNA 5-methoxyuridine(34)/uridine 5-oxyacetic acid(34) synthase CmoB [Acaryochloris thomasi]PZD70727.1 tRNA U34 carboxymethyltransferase [Acaryochloris thomasi RCC1774]